MKTRSLQLKNRPYVRRYAHVLFELAQEVNKSDKILDELKLFNKVLETIPQLITALQDKRIPLCNRQGAVSDIAKSMGLSKLMTHTILYLLGGNHFDLFPMISYEYQKITEAVEGLTRAQAIIADKILIQEVKDRIEKILTSILKTKSICETQVDPNIIGGILLKIGDVTLDTTITGKLKTMQEELL